jgi:hypothetical protein
MHETKQHSQTHATKLRGGISSPPEEPVGTLPPFDDGCAASEQHHHPMPPVMMHRGAQLPLVLHMLHLEVTQPSVAGLPSFD